MKALTLTQPWAQLVADGRKRFETRSWSTSYRGLLAIHAAKGWTPEDRWFAEELRARGLLAVDPDQLPRGAVIATCRLADVQPTGARFPKPADLTALELYLGDHSAGRFAWRLESVEPLTPTPARGALGLWVWDGAGFGL